MERTEKIRMHINIAGERIPLVVPFDSQDDVREAEKQVAGLFRKWHDEFPSKSDKELLAMIAYQYASYYLSLKQRYESSLDALTEMEAKLTGLSDRMQH